LVGAKPRLELRLAFLALGALALIAGLYGALARLGWTLPLGASLAALHGPLMISGLFGTLISLERAVALGLKRTALGAVRPADCDAFGRMRTELMMARISDGIPHLFDGTRPGAQENGARTGGAALEYRLIHLAWPRAGDRVELRSGSGGGDARFRRLIHWLLDPATGRPWGVAEAIAVSFDLETRKLITLSDAALAQANAGAVPGLTL
jgi:acyl-CoA thioester hydrolase